MIDQVIKAKPPKATRSTAYAKGRLPESERAGDLPGYARLNESTSVEVSQVSRDSIAPMFQAVAPGEMPAAARKGRASADVGNDPLFQALHALPADDVWLTDGRIYPSAKDAMKFQSKISKYASLGAGTFRTSYRSDGKVYFRKVSATFERQRGVA